MAIPGLVSDKKDSKIAVEEIVFYLNADGSVDLKEESLERLGFNRIYGALATLLSEMQSYRTVELQAQNFNEMFGGENNASN